MKSILTIYDLLPVLLLVLQTFFFLLCATAVLRYFKILQLPYAGMEYPKLVVAGAMLFSVMIISLSDVEGVVQSVKTFHNYDDGFYSNLFVKISQFMLVIVSSTCLFGLLCFVVLRALPGFRQSADAGNDMPGAILKVIVILIIAILLYSCTKAIIEPITPKYINFN